MEKKTISMIIMNRILKSNPHSGSPVCFWKSHLLFCSRWGRKRSELWISCRFNSANWTSFAKYQGPRQHLVQKPNSVNLSKENATKSSWWSLRWAPTFTRETYHL